MILQYFAKLEAYRTQYLMDIALYIRKEYNSI